MHASHLHLDHSLPQSAERSNVPLRDVTQEAHSEGATTPEELQAPDLTVLDVHCLLFAAVPL